MEIQGKEHPNVQEEFRSTLNSVGVVATTTVFFAPSLCPLYVRRNFSFETFTGDSCVRTYVI